MTVPPASNDATDETGAGAADARPGRDAPEPGMRGIWSRQTLNRRIVEENLVTKGDGASAFDEARLDSAGYRLAMGREVYVSPEKSAVRSSVRKLEEQEAFLIPAGQFAFLITDEVVTVPDDAFAFIALRSKKTKFRGLVNVSGFHADPGYHGRLVFAVFNAGPGDVHLRQGDELFAIMLADLDARSERPRAKGEGFMSIPSDLIAPIAGEVQSLAGLKESINEVRDDLDERLNSMERDVAVLRWSIALVLGAFVTLLVRAFTSS